MKQGEIFILGTVFEISNEADSSMDIEALCDACRRKAFFIY